MVYSPVCNNSQQLSRLSGMGHGRTQITGFISCCDLVHCMIHLERLAEKQFFWSIPWLLHKSNEISTAWLDWLNINRINKSALLFNITNKQALQLVMGKHKFYQHMSWSWAWSPWSHFIGGSIDADWLPIYTKL